MTKAVQIWTVSSAKILTNTQACSLLEFPRDVIYINQGKENIPSQDILSGIIIKTFGTKKNKLIILLLDAPPFWFFFSFQ
jgi:hypothetical protein